MAAGYREPDYNSTVLESWNQMIINAIDADARCHGLTPITPGQFWYWADASVWIDNLGVQSDAEGGGDRSPGQTLNHFDPVASIKKWNEKIPALWTDWEVTLPDPASYEPLRNALYDAAAQLAHDPKASKYHTSATDQQAHFSAAIQQMTGEIGGMDGAAMIAFNKEVAAPLPFTAKSQAAATLVAAYGVQAEQAVWKTARTNLDKTITDATNAFKQAYPGGGGTDLGWLSMVSEISGVLALVPGPQSAVLGTVSGIAGGLVTINDYLGTKIEPSPLRADSPDQVCVNITNALNDLNDSIKQGEHAIAQGCTAMKKTAHDDPTVYDLSPKSRPSNLDNDDPRDFLKIDVEYDKLKDIAESTLPAIAHGFDVAKSMLGPAGNSAFWDRPNGLGQNPYSQFSGLVGELDALMSSTAWKVRASAAHMDLVIKDFQKTDDWVAQASRDLTKDTRSVSYPGVTP